jgi:hypothetical protein
MRWKRHKSASDSAALIQVALAVALRTGLKPENSYQTYKINHLGHHILIFQ